MNTGSQPILARDSAVQNVLAAIVESSADAIISKDLDGRIQTWNRAAERLFGYSAEEVIGKPVSILAPPERTNEMPEILARVTRGERVEHYETVRQRKDGSTLHVALTVSPIRDSSGLIIGASKILRDISGRIAAEKALRESEERLRLAQTAAKIGSWTLSLVDPAQNYWSPEAYEIAGVNPAWHPDYGEWLSRIHPEDRDRVNQEVSDGLATGSGFTMSYRFNGDDNVERWHEARGNIQRAVDGSAVAAHGITLDITHRKNAELELDRSRQQFQAILSSIRESFIALDRNWRFTYVNDRVVEATGKSREELIGTNIWEIHPASKDTAFWPNYHWVMEKRQARSFEVSYPSGRHFEVHAHPTDDGLSALVLDISDRHLAEQALRKNETRSRLLADAGAALASSLDYEQTLRTVSKLSVPAFADWSAVDVLDKDGTLQRVSVQHADPRLIEFALELQEKYPPREGDLTLECLRTCRSAWLAEIPPELIEQRAHDAEHARVIRQLGLRSVIVVPMVARGSVLGVLSFVTAESQRAYTESDVAFAEDLARRAATAIDNARLYAAVQEQEARLRDIFNTAGEGICLCDEETRAVFANPRMAELFGCSMDKLIGRCLLDFVPAEHRESALRGFRSRINGDPSPPREYPIIRSDGSRRWMRISANVVRNQDGAVQGVLGMFEDVTELREAMQELRTTNERLKTFLQACPLAVMVINADGTVALWNRAAELLYGWTEAEVLGRTLPTMSDSSREETLTRLQAVLSGNEVMTSESVGVMRDGTPFVAQMWTVGLNSGEGQRQALTIVHDITARKRNESALSESEARFRELANAVPAVVWVGDQDGRITFLNDRWSSYTGLTIDSTMNENWAEAIHPEDVESARKGWETAIRTKTPFESECRIRGVSGEYRWFMARALPVRNSNGEILQWFGSSTDIHDSKRTEVELRHANADLQQFAYSASHDLKEPLRMIAVYSQLLERRYKGHFDKEGEKFLHLIIEGARRMDALVSDLLAYTQVIRRSDSPVSVISADPVLDTAVSNLKQTIDQTGAIIERDPLPKLCVEEVHLLQLFQNVLGNALKYRSSQLPQIRVSSVRDGEYWRICIRDNGIGIAPEYREQIFGLFRRLHSASEYSGTGLGLAICQKVVHRYGGMIWVESEGSGTGSTFCFTLPAGD